MSRRGPARRSHRIARRYHAGRWTRAEAWRSAACLHNRSRRNRGGKAARRQTTDRAWQGSPRRPNWRSDAGAGTWAPGKLPADSRRDAHGADSQWPVKNAWTKLGDRDGIEQQGDATDREANCGVALPPGFLLLGRQYDTLHFAIHLHALTMAGSRSKSPMPVRRQFRRKSKKDRESKSQTIASRTGRPLDHYGYNGLARRTTASLRQARPR